MEYQTSKYFANKWGITERRVIKLCKDGRIDGAIRNSLTWMIPENALKPADKRSKMSKYLNTQKKVLIVNSYEKISQELEKQIKVSGYQVDNKICKCTYRELKTLLEQSDTYYDGLIMFYLENTGNYAAIETFIKMFSEKMNFSSSIVLVTSSMKYGDIKISPNIFSELMNQFGVRFNILNIKAPLKKDLIINYNQIVQDIVLLFSSFKDANGNVVNTSTNSVVLDSNGKSKMLDTGKFYRVIDYLYSTLKQSSHVWIAQIIMEDDWSEDALEMQYRKLIVQSSYLCQIDNLLVVSHNEIPYIKKSNIYKIYENSNINTIIVDLDEISEKSPLSLVTLGNGWTGINNDILIVNDIKDSQTKGYVSTNPEIIKKSRECFNQIKKYGTNIKEI